MLYRIGPSHPTNNKADPPAQRTSVRFSGTASSAAKTSFWRSYSFSKLNTLMRLFRPVMEVFMVGIMAIDVIALWMPRIFNALTIGAFEYKPDEDPTLKGKTGFSRFTHIASQRFKRLNWINGLEECSREAASGPAVFVGPTLMFLLARRLGDKTGIELGRRPLNHLVDTFVMQMKKHPIGTDEQQFKASMKQFVASLFGEAEFTTQTVKGNPNLTYQQAIESWSDKWVEESFKGRNIRWSELSKQTTHNKTIDRLKTELLELIYTFNREHKTDIRAHRYGETPIQWFEYQGKKGYHKVLENHELPLHSAEKMFEYLTRWKDFAFNVLRESTLYSKGVTPQLLDYSCRRLKFRKALFSVISTLATLIFLSQLVKWTQTHNKYPAYRLLNSEEGILSLPKLQQTQPVPLQSKWPQPQQPFIAPFNPLIGWQQPQPFIPTYQSRVPAFQHAGGAP